MAVTSKRRVQAASNQKMGSVSEFKSEAKESPFQFPSDPAPTTEYHHLDESMTAQLQELSSTIEFLHQRLRNYLPTSEFEDTGNGECNGKASAHAYPDYAMPPVQTMILRSLHEMERLNLRVQHIASKVFV